MMGQKFAKIVEECLERLDRGENLPEIVADYADLAEQLEPLLLVAMASRAISVPTPNQTAQRLGRNQMLAEMDQVSSPVEYHGEPWSVRIQGWFIDLVNAFRARTLIQQAPSYRLALAALVMVFGVGIFTISVSASDLPGGVLGSFASDFQDALGIFSPSSESEENSFPGVRFLPGGDLYLGESRAAKVAFLLDLVGEDANSAAVVPLIDASTSQESLHDEDPSFGEEDEILPGDDYSDDDSDLPDDLPDTSAAEFAPGQQKEEDESAKSFAPGQQKDDDESASDYAPGQVKKLDNDASDDDGDEDVDKDKVKGKDKKDKKK